MRRTAPLAERLANKVTVGGPDECWPWTGATTKFGHGVIGLGRREDGSIYAHRAAYLITNGDLPDIVRHTCDNPPCCNPAHLLPGTREDNNKDMAVRGRAARGANHHWARLTEDQARAIKQSPRPPALVAAEYGVSTAAVYSIRNGLTWSHL